MRCSTCSEPVRPVVAIDIDGTLAGYHGHFLAFAASWLGRPDPSRPGQVYDGSEPFKAWFQRAFAVDLTTFRAIKLAYRQGGMKRTMPAYPGARLLIDGLRDGGAEVWLTTTRPWERFDRVDPDTRDWLRRQRIGYDGLLFHEQKMDELADRIDVQSVVAVLDDEVDVLFDATRYGWTPLLRVTKYNRAMEWSGEAVGTLHDALPRLTGLINDWKDKNR